MRLDKEEEPEVVVAYFKTVNIEVKSTPEHAMKVQRGSRGIALLFL